MILTLAYRIELEYVNHLNMMEKIAMKLKRRFRSVILIAIVMVSAGETGHLVLELVGLEHIIKVEFASPT